ncbi:alpha/beta fold hydrolase [Spirillospora sp. NPDC127200]
MKKLAFVMVAAALGLAGTATGAAGAAGGRAPQAAPAPTVVWTDCEGLMAGRAQCAKVPVPLDYRDPGGKKIYIGISRYKHTDTANYQGALFVNPGGPAGSGLLNSMAMRNWLASRGHLDVAAKWDMIGFDPRGIRTEDFNPPPAGVANAQGPRKQAPWVGTEPILNCDPNYRDAVGPDYVPRSAAEERAWLARSKKYAEDCAEKFGWMLPHMGTVNHAYDVEYIRRALGIEKIGFYGFSYGTRFGATYATLFPNRVKRMVLDGIDNPSTIGYREMIEQNKAFERTLRLWFAWVARYHAVYGLGRTAEQVEATYYRIRAEARREPIGGKIGPSEFDDIVLNTGMSTSLWIPYAQALKDWVTKKDASVLLENRDPGGDDSYFAVRAAYEALDARWPRDWNRWRNDAARLHRQGYRSITWGNVWHHAPILFWPFRGGPTLRLEGKRGLPGIMLIHATHDGAMPVAGAYEMHRRFPSSRLMLELGGRSHANSLNGNACLDERIAAYLDTGALPAGRPGADVGCPAVPGFNDPDPTAPQTAAPTGTGDLRLRYR